MRVCWRNLLLDTLMVVALSCGATAQTRTITVDARERTYLVHRPPNLVPGKPAPLVIMLHGGFGTGSQAEESYRWDEEADRKGFVVAYPDGYRWSWNAGGDCCGMAQTRHVDDVGFLTNLIERLVRDEHIDPKRVYLTGMSNGAAMAYRYACEGTFPVAAIGAVSGSLAYPCAKPRSVSVMEIHGLSDQFIPYAGGHGTRAASDVAWLGVEATLAIFRTADGCPHATAQTSGVVQTTSWHCASGREVMLTTVADAGHQWPGAVPRKGLFASLVRLDPPSQALDATQVLWNFFARHSAD